MKMTSQDAFALAKNFRDVSVALGDYRYEHWDKLTPGQRRRIEGTEWSLLNNASDMTTMAVGLKLDETELSLDTLQKTLKRTKNKIKRLAKVKQVITVATAVVGLSAALLTKDFKIVAKCAGELRDGLKA